MATMFIKAEGLDDFRHDLEATKSYLQDASPMFRKLVGPIRRKFGERITSGGKTGIGNWPAWKQESTLANYMGKHQMHSMGQFSGRMLRAMMGGQKSVLIIGKRRMHVGGRHPGILLFDIGTEKAAWRRPGFGPSRAKRLRFFDNQWGTPGVAIFRRRVGPAPSPLFGRGTFPSRPLVVPEEHAETVVEAALEFVWNSPLFQPATPVG